MHKFINMFLQKVYTYMYVHSKTPKMDEIYII